MRHTSLPEMSGSMMSRRMKIRPEPLRLGERRATVAHGRHPEAGLLQVVGDDIQDVGLVVNDEDAFRHCPIKLSSRHARATGPDGNLPRWHSRVTRPSPTGPSLIGCRQS